MVPMQNAYGTNIIQYMYMMYKTLTNNERLPNNNEKRLFNINSLIKMTVVMNIIQ